MYNRDEPRRDGEKERDGYKQLHKGGKGLCVQRMPGVCRDEFGKRILLY